MMKIPDSMHAAWFEKFGAANEVLILGEIAKPETAAGEVLIRMKTTGVNPSDVKKRAGAFPDLLDSGLVVPHSDGAGVIESVGEGVSSQRVGERVWVYQAPTSNDAVSDRIAARAASMARYCAALPNLRPNCA